MRVSLRHGNRGVPKSTRTSSVVHAGPHQPPTSDDAHECRMSCQRTDRPTARETFGHAAHGRPRRGSPAGLGHTSPCGFRGAYEPSRRSHTWSASSAIPKSGTLRGRPRPPRAYATARDRLARSARPPPPAGPTTAPPTRERSTRPTSPVVTYAPLPRQPPIRGRTVPLRHRSRFSLAPLPFDFMRYPLHPCPPWTTWGARYGRASADGPNCRSSFNSPKALRFFAVTRVQSGTVALRHRGAAPHGPMGRRFTP